MYMSDDNPNVFGLTDREALYDKLSLDRVKQLVSECDKVVSFEYSNNNYGEFMFVTIVKGNHGLTMFGYGLHEQRDRYYVDTWSMYDSSNSHTIDKPDVGKDDALFTIDYEYDYWIATARDFGFL